MAAARTPKPHGVPAGKQLVELACGRPSPLMLLPGDSPKRNIENVLDDPRFEGRVQQRVLKIGSKKRPQIKRKKPNLLSISYLTSYLFLSFYLSFDLQSEDLSPSSRHSAQKPADHEHCDGAAVHQEARRAANGAVEQASGTPPGHLVAEATSNSSQGC